MHLRRSRQTRLAKQAEELLNRDPNPAIIDVTAIRVAPAADPSPALHSRNLLFYRDRPLKHPLEENVLMQGILRKVAMGTVLNAATDALPGELGEF